jgi:hypothetical protein
MLSLLRSSSLARLVEFSRLKSHLPEILQGQVLCRRDLSYIPKEKLERAPMQSALSFASTKEADLSNTTWQLAHR